MKRWTLRILVMVLLGVVTTVFVAWGLALQGAQNVDLDGSDDKDVMAALDGLWLSTFGKPARKPCMYSVVSMRGITSGQMAYWSDAYPYGPRIYLARIGLPSRAMQFHYIAFDDLETGVYPEYVYDVIFFQQMDGVAKGLPLRPILPGFLINTLFYAAIWFALIFGGRAHRRMIRRWQGHCPMCKYDLRGDIERGCPECGWGREHAL